MVNDVLLGSSISNTLTSINRAKRLFDNTSLRLATGLKVNSALDNPQNFFLSKSLQFRASDFARLLDGVGQSVRTIETANHGVEAIEDLVIQAEAIAQTSLDKTRAGVVDPAIQALTINTSGTPLNEQIANSNPVAYWRLDDAGGTAVNLGSGGAAINGTYFGGVSNAQAALYDNGGAPSAQFDGVNGHVRIPDSALINTGAYRQRTIEVVFNADDLSGRQVIYEEGATVNGLTIYIDNGSLYITGEDQGDWEDANFNAPILAGETYHAALVYDRDTQSFTGYLNGVAMGPPVATGNRDFPPHSGDIGIGRAADGVQWHDGESGGSGFFFNGRISDVAVYNTALTQIELEARAQSLNSEFSTGYINTDFENVIAQIDRMVIDANYRGINLLAGDNLRTDFNENRTSYLTTEGVDFTYQGLGIQNREFIGEENIQDIIDSTRSALKKIRSYGFTLSNDISIIQNRKVFSENLINTLESGSDDLIVADQNEQAANLLAGQLRLDLGITALSLAGQSQATILDIITGNA